MNKPTKEEIEKAREQVKHLFLDPEWFEVMRHWKGGCWQRDQVMCGLLVGMKIVESRQPAEAGKKAAGGKA